MSDYYIPQMNRKHSAASSQSSCDEDVTPATHSSNVSHESYMERSANYYAPSSHRKRTVSSQSSQDSEVSPAKRRYTTSTSFEGNPETSSQSEAENSQVSEAENTATSDGSDDSNSESEFSSPSFATPFNSSQNQSHSGQLRYSESSVGEVDRSYRSTASGSQSLLSGPAGGGVAAKLMARMGYQEGTGLGKHGQGRVAPVESSKQKGRRGLGATPAEFKLDDSLAWRTEEVSCRETINWMPEMTEDIPDLAELKQSMGIGNRKLTIDDETEFVHPNILTGVLGAKSVFDNLEGEEMRKARTHSNPFELIRGVIFQNRAAMKMANMDAAFDFMFTSPKSRNGSSLVQKDELLYFADICAGPGGFSEYVLWRKKWKCKGFGLTLKSGQGVNDFKLDEFYVSPSECFEPHYGVGGVDGDGDIYRQENIDAFAKFVKENSNQCGVHFVMADGGFSVEGQENVQEVLSKRLYLCQFLCAIAILRDGGHFVCKLFDVFTPFSVGLMYLMRYAFDKVCIMKPVTSRPANSERYIVCKGFRSEPGDVLRQYLTYVNLAFDDVHFGTTRHRKCIQHLVDLDTLKDDQEFYDYIYQSNCDLGQLQSLNLKKIQVFAKNANLRDERQTEIRTECLSIWDVPNELRSAPEKGDAGERVQRLLSHEPLTPLGECVPSDLDEIRKEVRSAYDYKVFVTGTLNMSTPPSLHYFYSMGRAHVFRWDGISNSSWKRVYSDDSSCPLQLDIPKDTLFVAEVLPELKGEGKGQRKMYALHIIDILFLYGEDWRKHSYNVRLETAKMFVSSITRTSRTRLSPIRVKQLYRIEEIPALLSNHLNFRLVKGCGSEPRLCYAADFHNHANCCHTFAGLHFVPYICKPWTMAYSQSQRQKYFYNIESKQSTYKSPGSAFSNFTYCMKNKLLLSSKNLSTRDKLVNLTAEMDEWIRSLMPWLH